jgi:hypothetical protein
MMAGPKTKLPTFMFWADVFMRAFNLSKLTSAKAKLAVTLAARSNEPPEGEDSDEEQ